MMIDPPSAASNPLRRYLHCGGGGKSTKAPFALITGATGGMGEEWAYGLASHGFNVILQGRNRTKLEKVQQTIESRKLAATTKTKTRQRRLSDKGGVTNTPVRGRRKSTSEKGTTTTKRRRKSDNVDVDRTSINEAEKGVWHVPQHVEVELLVCEATTWPNEGLEHGLDALLSRNDVRLTVVINNLGVQSEGYPRLEDLSRDEVADIVIANSLFPAEVTRRLLPALKQNEPSLLVTVTSIGAWTPTPFLSPYMGTKGFDVAFSHSLRSEMLCEGASVDVVCMVPGQVQSGMCAEPESLMVPTSRDWVRSALSSLRPGGSLATFLPFSWLAPPAGTLASASINSFWTRPKGVITPWWPHYAGMLVAQYGPSWLLDGVAVNTVRGLKRKHEAVKSE